MKKLTAYLLPVATFLTVVPQAFATNIGNFCTKGTGGFNPLCIGDKPTDISAVIGSVINLLFLIAAIIALFFLVTGGIKWVTSEGDTKNVEGARNQIIAAAVGLGVTFLSYMIINLLLQFFLGSGLNALKLPTFGQ